MFFSDTTGLSFFNSEISHGYWRFVFNFNGNSDMERNFLAWPSLWDYLWRITHFSWTRMYCITTKFDLRTFLILIYSTLVSQTKAQRCITCVISLLKLIFRNIILLDPWTILLIVNWTRSRWFWVIMHLYFYEFLSLNIIIIIIYEIF